MGYFTGPSKALPDQSVPAVDPEVERLARVMIDGLIARLAAEPAVPASSLLDSLGDQLQQAANLRRLGVVRRTGSGAVPRTARPRAQPPRGPAAPPR
jgi:hypothetical protein